MSEAQSLYELLPREFLSGEYEQTAAFALRGEFVRREYKSTERVWPGREKYVRHWYVLCNGQAVGWNENPSKGWSFPVISFSDDAEKATGPKVQVKDLWCGDRFLAAGGLWTYLGANGDGEYGTARKHSKESTALKERGYGYMDSICSFKLTDKVYFQPI